jgi:peptidoglycan/xylan/chitin deacetylase (PgdA/CDA1 family)
LRRRFFFTALLLLFNVVLFGQNIILRIDDFGLDRAEFYPDLIKVINNNNAKVTIGTVPFNLNADIAWSSVQESVFSKFSEDPNVEIALHGYSHKSWSSGTEFAGRPYADQLSDISKGYSILKRKCNKSIITFIPPFNSYDKNTVAAVKKSGLGIISGGVSDPLGNDVDDNLVYVPFTVSLDRFIRLVDRNKLKPAKTYIILMHEYDFAENRNFYESMDNDLYNIKGAQEFSSATLEELNSVIDILNKNGAKFYTIAEFAGIEGKRVLSSEIMRKNRILMGLPLPPYLLVTPPGYLLTTFHWWFTYSNILISVLFYLALIIISCLFFRVIYQIRLNLRFLHIFTLICCIICLVIIGFGFRDSRLGYKALVALSILPGIGIQLFRRHKNT